MTALLYAHDGVEFQGWRLDVRGRVRGSGPRESGSKGSQDTETPPGKRERFMNLEATDCPPELYRLGRTLTRWQATIVKRHRARLTNGPTEAVNNLIKRVKLAAFGFHRFACAMRT